MRIEKYLATNPYATPSNAAQAVRGGGQIGDQHGKVRFWCGLLAWAAGPALTVVVAEIERYVTATSPDFRVGKLAICGLLVSMVSPIFLKCRLRLKLMLWVMTIPLFACVMLTYAAVLIAVEGTLR
jgi:hypothetical protein